jgi:Flp pilus assembly protein TadG
MPARDLVRRRRGDTRGAAAIEFALVLPIVLLLVCGIVDFGRMLDLQIKLSGAAREGARWVALGQGDPTTRVRTAVGDPAIAASVGVSYSTCPSPPPTGASSVNTTVTATRAYALITPLNALSVLFGGAIPTSFTLTGTGVMRCGG